MIVWEEAAIASFVKDHNIGLTIRSLSDLDTIGERVTNEQYQEFIKNLKRLSPKVRNGYFLDKAVSKLVN